MTFVGCFFFVSQSHAQSGPQDIGQWDWLLNQQGVATVWRENTQARTAWDQALNGYGHASTGWHDTYGVHAVLLPHTSLTGALKRGWVMLWGLGKERTSSSYDRIDSYAADTAFPQGQGADQRFVSKVAMTPLLLWHPKDDNTTDDSHLFGYVRYLFDTDKWNDPNAPGDWPIYKLFCAGHAFLPDGKLFTAGGDGDLWSTISGANGDVGYVGLRLRGIFDSAQFVRSASAQQSYLPFWDTQHTMSDPRWYPTLTALPSGRTLIVGGTRWKNGDLVKYSENFEVYDPCTDSLHFREVPESLQSILGFLYPRLHLVSYMNSVGEGLDTPRVVYTGFDKKTYYLNALQTDSDWFPYSPERSLHRTWGSSVLLPNPKDNPQSLSQQVLNRVMVVGGDNGAVNNNVTNSTEIMTFGHSNSLSIASGLQMNAHRMHVNTVLLPTGDVLAVGGINSRVETWEYPDNVVFATELYPMHPSTGQTHWKNLAPSPTIDQDGDGISDGTRVYHSTALLLPDGRVLTAGSATKDSNQTSINNRVPTIYSPPYLFNSDGERRSETERPQIAVVSTTELNYGQDFTVSFETQNESEVVSVLLIRPGSVTHSFNFEQRLIKLRFNSELDYLKVTSPWDPAIAPPGWYMLFLLDENGIPSEAAWVKIKPPNCEGEAAMFLRLELQDVATEVSAEQADQVEHSPICIEFRELGSGEVVESYTLPMFAPDTERKVSLPIYTDLSPTTYTLYIQPYRSWLGKQISFQGEQDGPLLVSLRNGDVNGDNVVDALDLALALEQIGESDSVSERVWSADVNLDGVVDENDLAIIAENLGAEGDQ
ncbi:MAG: DUF1929 domain-containing protein [Fimbriimonadia bacterium]|nr:DUF1929 domain-containing protein [Fimbriimonadia bacterium]